MGIESFGGYMQKRFKECISTDKPKNIDSLFIDANGIFYDAARNMIPSELNKKEKEKLEALGKDKIEEKIIKNCGQVLKDIILQFSPQKNLIVAVDGLANAAKMNQQKSRRYGKKSEEEIRFFDTRVFTPGTAVMIKIDKIFQNIVKELDNIPNIIYSSHLVPGEAEHKIFDLIRDNKLIEDKGTHILHGADSDLVVLSLLSDLDNIFVYRNNISSFYDINKFKNLVKDKLRNRTKNKIIYQDFSILTYFIGNDFLPRLPNLPSVIPTMDIMLKIYNKINKDLTNDKGDIIWSNFDSLFNCLDKWKRNDYNLYENNFIKQLKYPYQELNDSIILRNMKGKVINSNYDPSLHYINFDLKKFADLWYNKQFAPKNKKLSEAYKNKEYFTTRDIIKMIIKYLQSFQWVLKYYLLGPNKVPNSFFYPYKYTPITISIVNYMKLLGQKNKLDFLNKVMEMENYDFHIVHQLLMVLPPQKIDLIPKKFQKVYENALSSISPVDYPDPYPEGSDVDYNKKPDIPPINPGLTIFSCRELEIDKYLQTEKNLIIRNEISTILEKNDDDFKVIETILI